MIKVINRYGEEIEVSEEVFEKEYTTCEYCEINIYYKDALYPYKYPCCMDCYEILKEEEEQ